VFYKDSDVPFYSLHIKYTDRCYVYSAISLIPVMLMRLHCYIYKVVPAGYIVAAMDQHKMEVLAKTDDISFDDTSFDDTAHYDPTNVVVEFQIVVDLKWKGVDHFQH